MQVQKLASQTPPLSKQFPNKQNNFQDKQFILNTMRSAADGVEGQVNRVYYDVSNDAMSQFYNGNLLVNNNNNKQQSELVLPPIMSPLRGQVKEALNVRG